MMIILQTCIEILFEINFKSLKNLKFFDKNYNLLKDDRIVSKIVYFFPTDQKRFQDYISPGDEIEGLSTLRLSHDDSDPSNNIESIDHDQLPPDVLCHNLGLDIVIVITKTDYMSTLEKEYDFKEEHFDFIQQSVRKFCLKCSVKS